LLSCVNYLLNPYNSGAFIVLLNYVCEKIEYSAVIYYLDFSQLINQIIIHFTKLKIMNLKKTNLSEQISSGKVISNWLISALLITFFLVQACKKTDEEPVDTDPIVLDCDYFETDRVLENDPNRPVDFIVTCVAKVEGDIVVREGVVIEFQDDAGLYVEAGTLKAEGTSSKKVVFTGVNKIKGSWRGIFYASKSTNNILDHVVVSYAGGGSFNVFADLGNVVVFENAKVSITNTEISNGKEYGLNAVWRNTDIRAFNNNTITGNTKYPVISLTEYGHVYDGSNNFVGNDMDYIFLDGSYVIRGNRTWQKTNVPYLIDGAITIDKNESLTIEAGAELRFEDQSEIFVKKGGYLAVNGEASDMVLITGIVNQAGAWLGIMNQSDDLRNVIDFAEIAYAGGGPHDVFGELGTIVLHWDTYQKVTNSTMRDAATGAECAINAPQTNDIIEVENNTIINIPFEVCDPD